MKVKLIFVSVVWLTLMITTISIIHNVIDLKNNKEYNALNERLQEKCYHTEYGCCSITDYCNVNGERFVDPQNIYYLNIPKNDVRGSNCPNFNDILYVYIELRSESLWWYGRCRYNPKCEKKPLNRTIDIGYLPIMKVDLYGSNCPDNNIGSFISVYEKNLHYQINSIYLKITIVKVILVIDVITFIYMIYNIKSCNKENNFDRLEDKESVVRP